MDSFPFLFLNALQDTCLWRSILASTGAFLLGVGLFWLLFAKAWLQGWRQANAEIAQLQQALEKLKRQKSAGETLAFAKSLPGRKAAKSDQPPYGELFTPSNFQFFAGLDEHSIETMKAKGIKEWKDLANITLHDLQTIGLPYDRSILESLQQQAIWAITDNWQGIETFQREWIRQTGNIRTPLERAVMSLLGFSEDTHNLCIFAGIGFDIERLLHQGGVVTWQDLAAADSSHLMDLLNGVEGYHYLPTWSKQAQLALEGKWIDLNNYQDQLQQSADPDVSL